MSKDATPRKRKFAESCPEGDESQSREGSAWAETESEDDRGAGGLSTALPTACLAESLKIPVGVLTDAR